MKNVEMTHEWKIFDYLTVHVDTNMGFLQKPSG